MKGYLKGLDTLRAFAALLVVWSHMEYLKEKSDIPRITWVNIPNAHFSVTLFFVISGFLITFLLIKEKDKFGTISFKNFYARRILRIWPLYYLIVLLSYFLIEGNIPFRTIILTLFVAPNISLAVKSGWLGSPQIWSIGVEEQFYLFWPVIIYFVKEKFMIKFLLGFIFLYTTLPYILNFINIHTIYNQNLYSFIQKFFYYTKFNSMALGGLLGFSFAKNLNWIKILYQYKWLNLIIFLAPFILWFGNFTFQNFTEEVYSVFFAFMILAVIVSPNLNVDFKITKFLGKISYGIYMYHWIILVFFLKFVPLSFGVFYSPILYVMVFGCTILISWISYNTYEKYFLTIKTKFERK